MPKSSKLRSIALGILLLLTLAAAFVPTDSAEKSEPLAAHASQLVAPSPAKHSSSDDVLPIAITRPLTVEPTSNPFSASSWLPPPLPPPPAAPPAPPSPPQIPFNYLGRLDDGDKLAALLGESDVTHAGKVGDVINSVWRIERISEQSIDFTYLPLDAQVPLVLRKAP
jgi:hypothetical protein